MANDKHKLTLEVDERELGVVTRHHVRKETDQAYRDRFLTPPGGVAPGEGDKPADEISGDVPAVPGVVAAGSASS